MSHFLADRNRHNSPTSMSVEISPNSHKRYLKQASLLSFSSYLPESSDAYPSIYKSTLDTSDPRYLHRSSMFLTETDCSKPLKTDLTSYLDPNQNLSNLIQSCSTIQTNLVDIWNTAKKSLKHRQSNVADLNKNLKTDPKLWIHESDYLAGKVRLEEQVRAERADCIANKIGLVDDLLSPKNSSSTVKIQGNNDRDSKPHIFISGKDLSSLETARLISINKRPFAKKFDKVILNEDKRCKLKGTRSQCELFQGTCMPQGNHSCPFKVAGRKYEGNHGSLSKRYSQGENLNKFNITQRKSLINKSSNEVRPSHSQFQMVRAERISSSNRIPEPVHTNSQLRVSPVHNSRLKNFSIKTVSMLKDTPKQKVPEENKEIYEDIMNLLYDMKYGIKLST